VRDGRQRPADVTCVERCGRFPRCVPSASSKLKASIDATLQAAAAERDSIVTVLDRLRALLPDDQAVRDLGLCIDESSYWR